MASIEYPHDVIRELNNLRDQAGVAVGELFKLEREMVDAEIEADRQEAQAFLDATGTIPERQAWARLQSLKAKEAAEVARIKVNYAKNRMKQLSEAVMAVQTSARMVELQFKTAGVEERRGA